MFVGTAFCLYRNDELAAVAVNAYIYFVDLYLTDTRYPASPSAWISSFKKRTCLPSVSPRTFSKTQYFGASSRTSLT